MAHDRKQTGSLSTRFTEFSFFSLIFYIIIRYCGVGFKGGREILLNKNCPICDRILPSRDKSPFLIPVYSTRLRIFNQRWKKDFYDFLLFTYAYNYYNFLPTDKVLWRQWWHELLPEVDVSKAVQEDEADSGTGAVYATVVRTLRSIGAEAR